MPVRHDEVERIIESLIAAVLQIDPHSVVDDLEYRSIMEWDSLAHITLMLHLEESFGVEIDSDRVAELASVRKIKHFLIPGDHSIPTARPATPEPNDVLASPVGAKQEHVRRGLAGVYVDHSSVTAISGTDGVLAYRGYDIGDLVERSTFEETAFLLVRGELPTQAELAIADAEMRKAREIPEELLPVLRSVARAHPIAALRTGLSVLGSIEPDAELVGSPGVAAIARAPTIVATHHRIRSGLQPIPPRGDLSHAANYLWMLTGKEPDEYAAHVIERILILHADHGSNASAFAGRVVASTRSDLYAALVAAVAAFAGDLHGGAIENVATLVEEIGEADNAETYVRALQAQNKPVMGFGHRVYQTEDPRARHLGGLARELSERLDEPRYVAILDAVVEAMAPYAAKGVNINVDFYAGVIYQLLGLPKDLFVSTFAIGRLPGWVAQVQEQYTNNILIRPLLDYVGPKPRAYVQVSER